MDEKEKEGEKKKKKDYIKPQVDIIKIDTDSKILAASPHYTGLGSRMNFSKFNVFPKNKDFRSLGFSVRPVAIEHP